MFKEEPTIYNKHFLLCFKVKPDEIYLLCGSKIIKRQIINSDPNPESIPIYRNAVVLTLIIL